MSGTTSDPEVCQSCLATLGLCHWHARGVLPQLKEPSWYRQAHSGMFYETGKHKPSPAAQRVIDRKERKAQKRKAQRGVELHRGLGLPHLAA